MMSRLTRGAVLKARIAGVLYLMVIIGGIFAEVFVRGSLIVSGDAAQTAHNILSHELLYRSGFAAHIFILLCNIPLTLIFYELLRVVSKSLSLLMVFFMLVGTAIEAVNLFNHFAPLILLGGGQYLSAIDAEPLQDMAYMSLRLFAVGFGVSLVFFGGYCLVTGYLIFKSTFLPRILGLLLAIGGLCYLTNSFTLFLAPQVAGMLFPYILLPSFLAESSLCLWLIVFAVNAPKWEQRARAAADYPL